MEPEENDKCLSGSPGLCLSLPHLGEARPQNSRPETSPASHDLDDAAEGVEGQREEELDSFRVLKLGCCHLPSPSALAWLGSHSLGKESFSLQSFPPSSPLSFQPLLPPFFSSFPSLPFLLCIFSPLPHFTPLGPHPAPGDFPRLGSA